MAQDGKLAAENEIQSHSHLTLATGWTPAVYAI